MSLDTLQQFLDRLTQPGGILAETRKTHILNVGQKNRWALIQCLREEFEKQLEKIPEMMIHNFSNKDPFYTMTVSVHTEKFHRLVLEKELEDVRLHVLRLEKKLKEAEGQTTVEKPQPPKCRFMKESEDGNGERAKSAIGNIRFI